MILAELLNLPSESGSESSWPKTAGGCWGGFGLWRELGGGLREIGGARGQTTARAGLAGESAFESGAGDRAQGGSGLP